MNLELPYPAKILWPNGRGHHMVKHRAFQKHRAWACYAFIAQFGPCFHVEPETRITWSVTFYPKTKHKVDRDNAAASLKAYQDGIASAMQIDDNRFDNPRIHFAEPVKNGRVVICLGEG